MASIPGRAGTDLAAHLAQRPRSCGMGRCHLGLASPWRLAILLGSLAEPGQWLIVATSAEALDTMRQEVVPGMLIGFVMDSHRVGWQACWHRRMRRVRVWHVAWRLSWRSSWRWSFVAASSGIVAGIVAARRGRRRGERRGGRRRRASWRASWRLSGGRSAWAGGVAGGRGGRCGVRRGGRCGVRRGVRCGGRRGGHCGVRSGGRSWRPAWRSAWRWRGDGVVVAMVHVVAVVVAVSVAVVVAVVRGSRRGVAVSWRSSWRRCLPSRLPCWSWSGSSWGSLWVVTVGTMDGVLASLGASGIHRSGLSCPPAPAKAVLWLIAGLSAFCACRFTAWRWPAAF